MDSWVTELQGALAENNPECMRAALERVPKHIFASARPFMQQMARQSAERGDHEETIVYLDRLLGLDPDDIELLQQRAAARLAAKQFPAALADASRIVQLQPHASAGHRLCGLAHEGLGDPQSAIYAFEESLRRDDSQAEIKGKVAALMLQTTRDEILHSKNEPTTPGLIAPEIIFNPARFSEIAIPDSLEETMVEGLTQHLKRYSDQYSPKEPTSRLGDATWLAAWDSALARTQGAGVAHYGSELGVFALVARNYGSRRTVVIEPAPLARRIASGIMQKNLLRSWRVQNAEVEAKIASEEGRRGLFDAFTKDVDIYPAQATLIEGANLDYVSFPNIDHSLLGTGIVRAINWLKSHRAIGPDSKSIPATARIFACGIQWTYEGSPFALEPVEEFRWSLYPLASDTDSTGWVALTDIVEIGLIDFVNFREVDWLLALPAIRDGFINGVMYWFELDLGASKISNAPGSPLRCIKPAIQYVDSAAVNAGQVVRMTVAVRESRLYFQTSPPVARHRKNALPSWYVPMMLDKLRNDSFHVAIVAALAMDNSINTVLDIGAGMGLLSMMAAKDTTVQVIACEVSPAISALAKRVLQLNGLENRIRWINKDCRAVTVPEDMPTRAELAVFEMFDCSLIGEGVLHFLEYARKQLLTPNARYLPMRATIRAMLIEQRVDNALDVDINLLNPFRSATEFINVDSRNLNYRTLSDPFDVFSFDFATATSAAEERAINVFASDAGIVGAVLFWFDLRLDDTTWLSNSPSSAKLHWGQGLQYVTEVEVDIGTPLSLSTKHDGSALRFDWTKAGIDMGRASKLPRFDQRTRLEAAELEMQTQKLFQHLMEHPEDYRNVATLAASLAIDPAAHGIDPSIAQRFASMFFA